MRAKMFAALRGLTLKDFILESVQKAIDQSDAAAASSVLFGTGAKERSGRRTGKQKTKR